MCLARGTKVALIGRGKKSHHSCAVEDVQVGDRILGQYGHTVHVTEKEFGQSRHMFTIHQLGDDSHYTVTPEHRVTLRCRRRPQVEIVAPADDSNSYQLRITWLDAQTLTLRTSIILFTLQSSSSSASSTLIYSYPSPDSSSLHFPDFSQALIHGWSWLTHQSAVGAISPLQFGDLFELTADQLYDRWRQLVPGGEHNLVEGYTTTFQRDDGPEGWIAHHSPILMQSHQQHRPWQTTDTDIEIAYLLHDTNQLDTTSPSTTYRLAVNDIQHCWHSLDLPHHTRAHVSNLTSPTHLLPHLISLLDAGANTIVLLGSLDLSPTILSHSSRLTSIETSFTTAGLLCTRGLFDSRPISILHANHPSDGRIHQLLHTIAFAHRADVTLQTEHDVCQRDGITLTDMIHRHSPNQDYVSIEVDGNHRFALAGGTLTHNSKCEVIKKESHIRMVWTERNIMSKLSETSNPFLVTLEHAFQDERELFLAMEFMQGGDLRYHLTQRGIMTESECRFYAAEMILALESLHRQKIIYRDFKPDNILLDGTGHIVLSDFGLAVQLEEKYHYVMRGNAGTAAYLAPEIWAGDYYGISPDVFSFGITCYELLHGRRPYRRWNPAKNYIDRLKFMPNLSSAARSFLQGVLTVDPRKRLACGPSGWQEAKNHPWFAKIDWNAIQNKIIKPPIKPDIRLANCSNQADLADQLIDKKPAEIPVSYHKYFTGFDYNVNFGEWLVKNEKKKEERARKAEEAKRVKEDHKKFRRQQMAKMLQSGQPMSPLSPSSSSGANGSEYFGGPLYANGLTTSQQNNGSGLHLNIPPSHPLYAQQQQMMNNSYMMNVSSSHNSVVHPALDPSHIAVDYVQPDLGNLAGGGNHSSVPSTTNRPRLKIGPSLAAHSHYDPATPVVSNMQPSWHQSASDDSHILESDINIGMVGHHQSALGMMMSQPSPAASHSRPGSTGPPFYSPSSTAGGLILTANEEPGIEELLRLEDSHILQLTQRAHHAHHSTPPPGSNHSPVQMQHHTASSSPLGPHDPATISRLGDESDITLSSFRPPRERSDARRKTVEMKSLKQRTYLGQALLAVVRAKPSDFATTLPYNSDRPPSEEEKSLTHKFAEMLQKDRENIRKLMHGDSVLSSEAAQPPVGITFRSPTQSASTSDMTPSVRMRSITIGSGAAATPTEVGGNGDSPHMSKGLIAGMSVLGPGGLGIGNVPVFPYGSTGHVSPTHTASSSGPNPNHSRLAHHTSGIAVSPNGMDSSSNTPSHVYTLTGPSKGAFKPIAGGLVSTMPVRDDRIVLQTPDPLDRRASAELAALHLVNAGGQFNPYGSPNSNTSYVSTYGVPSGDVLTAPPTLLPQPVFVKGGSLSNSGSNSPRHRALLAESDNPPLIGGGVTEGGVVVGTGSLIFGVPAGMPSSRPDSLSAAPTPAVRHRIHVSRKQPVSTSSNNSSSSVVLPDSHTHSASSHAPSQSPTKSKNLLDQWDHIAGTIKKIRESGRKIQLCVFLDCQLQRENIAS